MATTALIVEILVIGTFALVWVALFVIKIFGVDASLVSAWLVQYKDWSTGIILMSIAIAYQLGWSVNQLSYFFARNTFNKKIRMRVFKNKHENFDTIKNKVLMQGSSFVVEKILERLSVVRLTRSAFLNFLLISIALFTLGNWQLGLASLGISIILFVQANDIYSLYCKQIFNAYKVINSNSEKQVDNENLKPASKSHRAKRG